jgi:hypothetical protein
MYVAHLWLPISLGVDIVVLATFTGYSMGLFSMFVGRLLRGDEDRRTHAVLGAWLVLVVGALATAIPVRGVLYRHAANSGAAIIEAITRYEIANGGAPPDLQSLVPHYLPAVPSSGLSFCPYFSYGIGVRKNTRTWSLALDCALLYPPFAVLRYESWRASDPEYVSGWALGD